MKIYLIAVSAMSLLALILYGTDKTRARHRAWRIRENVLLGVGILGGAAGGLLGMILFHHKTRHGVFWAVNLFSLAIHIAVLYGFFHRQRI